MFVGAPEPRPPCASCPLRAGCREICAPLERLLLADPGNSTRPGWVEEPSSHVTTGRSELLEPVEATQDAAVDRVRAVRSAVAKLPAPLRIVIDAVLDGRSVAAVSREIGITKAAGHKRYERAVELLERMAGEDDESSGLSRATRVLDAIGARIETARLRGPVPTTLRSVAVRHALAVSRAGMPLRQTASRLRVPWTTFRDWLTASTAVPTAASSVVVLAAEGGAGFLLFAVPSGEYLQCGTIEDVATALRGLHGAG